MLGAIIQCSSYTVAQLIVGRIITGVGIGMLTSGVPVYQAECCEPEDRGRNACIFNWICICGVTSSYWVGYAFSFVDSQAQWRFPVALQCVFSIVIWAFLQALPETPRWLVHHDYPDEARRVIARLVLEKEEGDDVDDVRVRTLFREIEVAIATEKEAGSMSVREMFSGGSLQNGRRMALCLLAGLGCQMSGTNLMTQYAPIIFQKFIGMSRSTSQLVAGFNSHEYMLATILPIYVYPSPLYRNRNKYYSSLLTLSLTPNFYIERVGRRKVLMWGAFGQMLSMLILAITVHDGGYAAGIVGAAMLFLFNTVFAQGC